MEKTKKTVVITVKQEKGDTIFFADDQPIGVIFKSPRLGIWLYESPCNRVHRQEFSLSYPMAVEELSDEIEKYYSARNYKVEYQN